MNLEERRVAVRKVRRESPGLSDIVRANFDEFGARATRGMLHFTPERERERRESIRKAGMTKILPKKGEAESISIWYDVVTGLLRIAKRDRCPVLLFSGTFPSKDVDLDVQIDVIRAMHKRTTEIFPMLIKAGSIEIPAHVPEGFRRRGYRAEDVEFNLHLHTMYILPNTWTKGDQRRFVRWLRMTWHETLLKHTDRQGNPLQGNGITSRVSRFTETRWDDAGYLLKRVEKQASRAEGRYDQIDLERIAIGELRDRRLTPGAAQRVLIEQMELRRGMETMTACKQVLDLRADYKRLLKRTDADELLQDLWDSAEKDRLDDAALPFEERLQFRDLFLGHMSDQEIAFPTLSAPDRQRISDFDADVLGYDVAQDPEIPKERRAHAHTGKCLRPRVSAFLGMDQMTDSICAASRPGLLHDGTGPDLEWMTSLTWSVEIAHMVRAMIPEKFRPKDPPGSGSGWPDWKPDQEPERRKLKSRVKDWDKSEGSTEMSKTKKIGSQTRINSVLDGGRSEKDVQVAESKRGSRIEDQELRVFSSERDSGYIRDLDQTKSRARGCREVGSGLDGSGRRGSPVTRISAHGWKR